MTSGSGLLPLISAAAGFCSGGAEESAAAPAAATCGSLLLLLFSAAAGADCSQFGGVAAAPDCEGEEPAVRGDVGDRGPLHVPGCQVPSRSRCQTASS